MFMLILGFKYVCNLHLSHWDMDLLRLSEEKGLIYTPHGIILSSLPSDWYIMT